MCGAVMRLINPVNSRMRIVADKGLIMDDFGNDLVLYWGNDLRLLLANDQSMGAHGFCPFIGRACFAWMMADI